MTDIIVVKPLTILQKILTDFFIFEFSNQYSVKGLTDFESVNVIKSMKYCTEEY